MEELEHVGDGLRPDWRQVLASADRDQEEQAPETDLELERKGEDVRETLDGLGRDGRVELHLETCALRRRASLERPGEGTRRGSESVVGAGLCAVEREGVRRTPAAHSARIVVGFARGVPAGATDIARPEAVPWRTSVRRSARRSGSPPVRTTMGRGAPSEARSSSTPIASCVESWPGPGSGWASARQWRQARSQARVTSKRTKNGRAERSKRRWRTRAASARVLAPPDNVMS